MLMNWTESGWVCDLELKGGESIEFKFVVITKDKNIIWERGDNRTIKLPKVGSYKIVCQLHATAEPIDLLPLDLEENEVDVEGEGEGENGSVSGATLLEVETSPFVGQWKGKDASFMRSNEHRNRETERKWDTSGLEGLALALVEGDRNARNWRKKVFLLNMPSHVLGLLKITMRHGNIFSLLPFKMINTNSYC